MKICRVCPYYFMKKENLDGGLKPYYFNVVRELKKIGIENDIVTLESDSGSKDGVYIVKTRKRLSYILFGYDAYKELKANNKNYDIIHTHQANSFLLYFFKNRFKNTKFVHTIHGSPIAYKKVPVRSISNFKDVIYAYLFNRYICKKTDTIITVSSEGKEEAIKNFKIPENKVYFIPTGVDIHIFKKLDIKKDIDILYVGRFAVKKNLLLLLDVAHFLKKEFPNIKVYLVGGSKDDDDYNRIIEKIKTLALENNVVIQFALQQDKLVNIYNRAKLFMLLSFEEGLPKVLLEASACGLPAIVSDNSGMKDVIIDGENGFFADINNKESIVEKANRILRGDHNLVLNGRIIKSKFSWNKITQQLSNLYKNL